MPEIVNYHLLKVRSSNNHCVELFSSIRKKNQNNNFIITFSFERVRDGTGNCWRQEFLNRMCEFTHFKFLVRVCECALEKYKDKMRVKFDIPSRL